MTSIMKTEKERSAERAFGRDIPMPGLLVAYAPKNAVTVDRCLVKSPFVVGRQSSAGLSIQHETVSGEHFRIAKNRDKFYIEDLRSTNHTFVNGRKLEYEQLLPSGSVIRAGQAILVFLQDAGPVFESIVVDPLGLVGRFHVGELVLELKEAVLSGRHLLLAGPSGAGKERAAAAVCRLLGKNAASIPPITHNAARFSSEEEAAATLFGVAPRVFSNVDARPGLIESAQDGVLFLDEVHNLPLRVQRSLLRLIEDGQYARIGETNLRTCRARFVFASNAPLPSFGLAPDLLARLRVIPILPLKERKADIPVLFDHLLLTALERHREAPLPVLEILAADHYESLLLDGFAEDNVRGLIDLGDRIATRVAAGVSGEDAIAAIFGKRFQNSEVARRFEGHLSGQPSSTLRNNDEEFEEKSHYETHKDLIAAAWQECEGNLSRLERMLLDRGIRCSRRWLGVYLDRWGLRSFRKPSESEP